MNKLAMIAFGGNALLRAGQKGTFDEQLENVERTCQQLVPLIEKGYDIVIGHGNGPQVGNALLRHEAGKKMFDMPAMPMDFCGAETQGSIAYLIETALERVLNRAGIHRRIVSLVTRVEVAADDPAFQNPTKPVGPYYKEKPQDGATYKEDPRGLGWRKVVASPKPIDVHNIDLIEKMAREGSIVITVGGGGIPVIKKPDGYRGIEAVIDKDLASTLCAIQMKADEFYILTDVAKVYINFRKPGEMALDAITVAEAERYLAEGQFAEGSMAPKVRAGILFVKNGGAQCVITEAGQLGNPACGTRIIP
ncbi:MAG: carbamate kinase [Bacteroidales bacterium]|nr:carbamate kinase [Bacteroidales bacterium]